MVIVIWDVRFLLCGRMPHVAPANCPGEGNYAIIVQFPYGQPIIVHWGVRFEAYQKNG